MIDITNEEKTQMRDWIATYSAVNPEDVQIDKVLEPWRACKAKYLYKLIGNTLIRPIENSVIEYPIEITYELQNILTDLYKILTKRYEEIALRDPQALFVLEAIAKIFEQRAFMAQTAYPSFKDKVRDTCFHKGEKWYKSARKLILKVCTELTPIDVEWCLNKIEEAQTQYSMLVQNIRSNSSKIMLSIHPLDYLTMSDNCCNWSSCMSWSNEGEYHAGTIEMMNSSCVVVAYIAQNDNTLFNGWNSKRWRQLFVVHPTCIIASCPYPAEYRAYTQTIFNEIKRLAAENLGWHYDDELHTIEDDDDTLEMMTETEGTYMYVDYLEKPLTCAVAWRAEEEYKLLPEHEKIIYYSGAPMCAVCGEEYIEESRSHLCEICDSADPNVGYCQCCNHREHLYTTTDGVRLCKECYDEATVYCDECNGTFYHSDSHSVKLKGDEEGDCYWANLCDNCYEYAKENDRILSED